MEFKIKQFAQLMILSHWATLEYDTVSQSSTNIDLYEIMEHHTRVHDKVSGYMRETFRRAMKRDDLKQLYSELVDAKSDDLFWKKLRARNEDLSNGLLKH